MKLISMLLVRFGGACLANSLYFDAELLEPETPGQMPVQFQRSKKVNVEIGDGTATRANQVMMGPNIRIYAPRSMMMAHVA